MGIACKPIGTFKGSLVKVDNKITKAKVEKIVKKKTKKN